MRGILVDSFPHSEYIKINDKSTAQTIYKCLCATCEGNQQVEEAKVNLVVLQYELFRMKEDVNIESMFLRFHCVWTSGLGQELHYCRSCQ